MKKSAWFIFPVLMCLVVLLSGCAPAATPIPATSTPIPPTDTPIPPTASPIPTETPVPPTATSLPSDTPMPAASGTGKKITTSAGTVVVTKTEIATEDAMGNKASPGYEILTVWFQTTDGSTIDGTAFYNASKGVYIMGDDGSKTISNMGGMLDLKLMVGFTPPVKAHKFTLYWPGNDPVELVLP